MIPALPALLALMAAGSPPADTPALEVARGRAALAEGDARAALTHARNALRADRDDWRAVQLWLQTGDALGLSPMLEAQAWTFAREGGPFRVAHAWTRVADGDLPRRILAEPDVRTADPRLTLLALGDQALDQGRPDLASRVLEDHPDPYASTLRLKAMLLEGRTRAATRFATESLHRYPAHPLSAVPLLDVEGSRPLRRAQAEIRETLHRRILQIDDPVVLWRLRAATIQAGLHASAARATLRLATLGEPARMSRRRLPLWNLELLVIRAVDDRDPLSALGLGSLTEDERRTVASLWVDRMERGTAPDPAVIDRVLERVRATADTAPLATRHAEARVAQGRTDAAGRAADTAVRLAVRPAHDDLGRLDRGRQALEVAQALAVRGRIALEQGRTLDAAVDLTVASLLVADGEGPLRDRALAALPPLPQGAGGGDAGEIDTALQAAVNDDDDTRALRLALVRAPSRVQWTRRMALALQAAAGREADPVARVALPALLYPTGDRMVALAEALDAIEEHDAAFVARAAAAQLGAGPVELERSWRGLGGVEPAAEIVGRAWIEADARARPASSATPESGEMLPHAELAALDGPLDLRDLRGQTVVMVTWTEGCAGCRRAILGLDAVTARARAAGTPVTLLAVSLDEDREVFRSAVRSLDREAVVFAQIDPVSHRWLRPADRPSLWLVGPDGRLRQRFSGWSTEHRRAIEAGLDAIGHGEGP